MPTVFINSIAVILPVRFIAGSVCSQTEADVLNGIQVQRIKSKLRWLLQKGDINADELQSRANTLSEAELVPYATLDDDEGENDPILAEALLMARDMIISRMAQEGLPPPKGIDLHAKALVDALPELQERARLRIEARYKAVNAAIGNGVI